MKKTTAILLVIVMLLSLCGCGKSEEVLEVERMIAELANLPMEYLDEVDAAREAIEDAQKAYDRLSDKDREKVENYDDLLDAQEAVFEKEYDYIVTSMMFLNLNCDYVSSATITVWDNVGASDFFTYYNCIFYFYDSEMTLADYNTLYGTDVSAMLWGSAVGLCPENVSYGTLLNEADTIEQCATFNLCYSNIEDACADIKDRVTRLNSEHSDEYSSKVQVLYDWWMDSYLYADLCLNPTGSLASYSSSVSTYRSNMERHSLNADMQ